MAGFRRPEVPRGQLVLWSHRLDDAIPADHPVRHFASLLGAEAFAETFAETFAAWERGYVLVEGKPPYDPRDLSGLYPYGMMNRIREQPESPDQSPERKRAGKRGGQGARGERGKERTPDGCRGSFDPPFIRRPIPWKKVGWQPTLHL